MKVLLFLFIQSAEVVENSPVTMETHHEKDDNQTSTDSSEDDQQSLNSSSSEDDEKASMLKSTKFVQPTKLSSPSISSSSDDSDCELRKVKRKLK